MVRMLWLQLLSFMSKSGGEGVFYERNRVGRESVQTNRRCELITMRMLAEAPPSALSNSLACNSSHPYSGINYLTSGLGLLF